MKPALRHWLESRVSPEGSSLLLQPLATPHPGRWFQLAGPRGGSCPCPGLSRPAFPWGRALPPCPRRSRSSAWWEGTPRHRTLRPRC